MPYTSYPYEVQPLPYEYNALEPAIDAETVRYHHDKHYQAYVDKLNAALEPFPQLQIPLEKLLTNPHTLPANIRTDIQRNGGGVMNHYLFFNMLAPYREDNRPGPTLERKLSNAFGSFDAFVQQFTQAAASVFGSGYAVLAHSAKGDLLIEIRANQDTVYPIGLQPLLLIDVWEHAYYLKYKNARADYLQNIWKVINFDVVS
ncbi:MAG: superoxide dismutase [Oscillospiraceae bacterium]|nr:superoxide dismutase [Oscillospiraceae bacterium]